MMMIRLTEDVNLDAGGESGNEVAVEGCAGDDRALRGVYTELQNVTDMTDISVEKNWPIGVKRLGVTKN